MRSLIEKKLNEARAYDSSFLRDQLDVMIDDEDREEVKDLLDWLAGRIEQSIPDGDVKLKDIYDFMKEPEGRKLGRKLKDWRDEIEYIWKGIS